MINNPHCEYNDFIHSHFEFLIYGLENEHKIISKYCPLGSSLSLRQNEEL